MLLLSTANNRTQGNATKEEEKEGERRVSMVWFSYSLVKFNFITKNHV